jgi:DNA-binding protein HU-beta
MFIRYIKTQILSIFMNKKELITKVFNETELTKKEIDTVLTKILETIMTAVSSGEKVQLVGFGSFSCSKKVAAINSTVKNDFLPCKEFKPIIKFSAGKFFKEKVNV